MLNVGNVLYPFHGCLEHWINTIQYNTIQYNTIQYNTIQYSILNLKAIYWINASAYRWVNIKADTQLYPFPYIQTNNGPNIYYELYFHIS
jgi:hypothetical protein